MPDGLKQTVIVVEDNAEMRALLRDFLSALGLQVHCYWSASSALQAMGKEVTACTLLLADLELPGVSGLDLIRQFKSDYPCLPSILISAYGTQKTAVEAREAGASGYLSKPFSLSALEKLISQVTPLASQKIKKG